MGPALYTLYSAPLHDIVADGDVQDHEFADDRQLYTSFRQEYASSAVSSLSESIGKSKTWMDGWMPTILNSMRGKPMHL